ncbi:FtsB family cell division protein [Isoalcanivorax beigongshangi]|uniref:Cell division protein FtsB n=1 Tax=Isoalcanivorax beigongshangi TaxID=3238810 RepID=A0ABV4AF76_9GAMM
MNRVTGPRLLLALLLVTLLALQLRLWFGEGSLRHGLALQQNVAELEQETERLRDRNRLMAADVADLKQGLDTVEEIARRDLGLIRDGETFYLVLDRDVAQ